jgi:hypothetical protein
VYALLLSIVVGVERMSLEMFARATPPKYYRRTTNAHKGSFETSSLFVDRKLSVLTYFNVSRWECRSLYIRATITSSVWDYGLWITDSLRYLDI